MAEPKRTYGSYTPPTPSGAALGVAAPDAEPGGALTPPGHDPGSASPDWDERPAMDPEDATHCLRVIQNDPDPQRRAFALGAMSTVLATCAVFPGARSDRMLAEMLRTLRDRVPWGDDIGEDHR